MPVVSLAPSGPSESEWSDRRLVIRPASVLQAALLLLVIGNLGRIPLLDLGERQAPLLINDICVAAVLGAGLIAMARARTFHLNDVSLAALLFAGIGAISAVAAVPRFGLSGFELVGSLAYLARWGLYFGLYIVVINCVRTQEVEPIWSTIERALLLIAAFGIVQSVFLPNFAFVIYPGARRVLDWDPQGNRLVSTVLEPNIISGMFAIVLLVQLARLAFRVETPIWKPTLLFAALVLTLSRSGMLAFCVGSLLVLGVRGMTKGVLKLGVAILILLLVASPKLVAFANQFARFGITDESALARVVTWQRALAVFIENPWFGIGFNTYGFVQDHRGFERLGTSSYSAEGGLLFIAVLTGLVGLIVYLCMLGFVLRWCQKGWRHELASPGERGLFLGTGAATIAILVHTIFVNSLFMPFVMELLWVLWGLTFVAAASLRSRDRMAAAA